jgi:hypothetical protein
MTHASKDAIQHLKKSAEKVKIDNSVLKNNSVSKINECESCALSKMHRIIFKSADNAESFDKSFFRVTYDLMQLSLVFNKDE